MMAWLRHAYQSAGGLSGHDSSVRTISSKLYPRICARSPMRIRNGFPGEMACSGGEFEARRSPVEAGAAPDPTKLHPVAGQPRVVLLKPLITSPLIEAGEFSYYDDPRVRGRVRNPKRSAPLLSGPADHREVLCLCRRDHVHHEWRQPSDGWRLHLPDH